MKKLFALLLVVVLLACPMTVLAEEDSIDIAVATVQAAAGAEEATVAVKLSNCASMDSIQLRINYDETAMRLTAVDTHGILDSGLHVLNTEKVGLLILAFASAEGVRADEGTLIELQFTLVNEAGSAVTVSEALATRYDAETGVQSKAYVTVQDGGVTFQEDGTLPEARITPWIPETPAPTPEPTPEPTEVPIVVPDAAAEADVTAAPAEKAEKKTGGVPLFLIIPGLLAIALFALAAWLIISDRKKKREAERRKAERMAARQAARRAARRAEQTAVIQKQKIDAEDVEELLPTEDTDTKA